MTLLYNIKNVKAIRQKLRKQQTKYEYKLWLQLRNKQLDGFKFYRQYSVGTYILDFYCPKKKLAIELDGSYHEHSEQLQRDVYRTTILNQYHITLLRFWNFQVEHNLKVVLEDIKKALNQLP